MGSPRASRRSPRTNRTASCAVARAPWPPCADVLSMRAFLLSVTRGNQSTWGMTGGRRPPVIRTPGRRGARAALELGPLDRYLHVVDHVLGVVPGRQVGFHILGPPVHGRRLFKAPVGRGWLGYRVVDQVEHG